MSNNELLAPVLSGAGSSDYERYLQTDALLCLQKTPSERVHRDELLFQVTHQSSELWLKLAATEASDAALLIPGDVGEAIRYLRRATMSIRFITGQLDMLEEMSPWEYQEIREVLGHGSGFDSPGFRQMRRSLASLGRAFEAVLESVEATLLDVYVERRKHETLHRLAEAMLDLDEHVQNWRVRHYRVVARVIGDRVVGTQGTPVEVLGRLVHQVAYPELWDVRNALTARSKAAGDVELTDVG